MSQNNIPESDKLLPGFATHLLGAVRDRADHDGLTQQRVDMLSDDLLAYTTALAITNNPATRTRPAILDKAAKKATLLKSLRIDVRIIQNNPATTNARRAQLGIHVPKQREPIGKPATAPAVHLLGVSGRTAQLRLHGIDHSRGKPAGVAGACIWGHVGPTAPSSDSQWTLLVNTSRTKVAVNFADDLAPGTTVWIKAAWYNPRTEEGPASDPISCNLPGFGPGQPSGAATGATGASADPIAGQIKKAA